MLVLIVVALAIAIATFDADRFRPLVISRLQEALGRPVQLERIALGWQGGIAIQLHGVAIEQQTAAPPGPLVRADSVSALVRLMPLLHRRLEISSLRVEQGVVRWHDAAMSPPIAVAITALEVTVKNVSFEAPMDIEANGAIASDAPNVHLRGRLSLPRAGHAGSIDQVALTVEHLPLEQLLPPTGPWEPQLRGRLQVALEGRVPTLEPTALTRSVSGRGRLALTEPVIVNLNVLRAALGQLSMIPGLVPMLEERLPPEYQEQLAAKDTVLSVIEISVQLEEGWLRFDDLRVSSETFQLIGAGRVGLDGTVLVRAILQVNPTLSAAIISRVHQLRALANLQGAIELPVTVEGRAPRVAVLPDLNAIAPKLVVTTAVDILGGLIPQEEAEADEAAEGDLLGDILRRVLDRNVPAE